MNQKLTQRMRHVIWLFVFSPFFILTTAQAQETQDIPLPPPLPIDVPPIILDEEDSVRIQPVQDTTFEFPEELIKERLAQIESDIPLHYNKDIKAFMELFTMRKRDYVRRVLTQQSFYFPIFETELKKNGMPTELKYLSVVESALNPKAVSRAGAVGLWQFMPYTGKESGLYQDAYIDERMDIYKSTRAACAYLKMLYGMFSDWELAMAAYNCGPGAVRKAIRRAGNKTSFWEIYPFLPKETRSYVPIYVATTYVMQFHQDYLFSVAEPRPYIESDTIHITQPVDLELLANELNISMTEVLAFNPHLKKSVIPAYMKNYPLRLPMEKLAVLREYKSDMFLAAAPKKPLPETSFTPAVMAASMNKRSSLNKTAAVAGRKKVTHTVASGDVLGHIAELYNVGVSELKRWNNLRNNTIQAGQKLAVWVQSHTWKQANKAEGDNEVTADANVKKGVYEVQAGDTLWSISKNQGVKVDIIKKLNKLKGNDLKPGQKLIMG
ncbi:transglycosylase SLT domain-containing protein [Cytophagaceae bacterium DM2B3-1]|uniref:Transglycosylase SLT domain-containing protein n=1 Tax=Xanthocytophaga flava TaxID=3048013 RepID=A0ABT7CUG7_9BACT|nr:transglycosylase SLT domain-containing protein [Xanthocytophaga flavus]MDJ1467088.1 transglycosylase SLT domain-containing protein [Xanthocytophaga flavus]MDJ1497416.1 transglycosylase SLT domain-containing protein [Xanthocytophaga flavus]